MSSALLMEQTLPATTLRHRLALGLSCIDALAGMPATGALRVELRGIGPYPLPYLLERHRADRHAARYAGEIRRKLDLAIAAGGDTRWLIDAFGGGLDGRAGYDTARDPRRFVPRRLAITLALEADQPAASALNIRTPWLWPGSAYPLPGTVTALRGRVLRGADLASGTPVRWARLIATTPYTETDFNLAARVGHGQADDRGEYVLALDAKAVAGAALSNPVRVRLWAFAAPAGGPIDASDPLDGLPVEDTGTAVLNDVLQGIAIPAAFTASVSQVVAIRLGEVKSGGEATVLLPP